MSTVFACAFALAGVAIGIRRLHDNSFLWHLRTGRYILDHGIPHHDPYSFSAHGAKWVAQSWLAELLYGVVWRAAGSWGLRLLGAVLGALVAVALYRVALRFANDRVRALGLAMLAFVCLLQVWSERPLMLGLAAMMVVVFVCEAPTSALGQRALITLPIVMWLWANVHGTFALGFLYLGLHLGGRWLDGAPPSRGPERAILRGSVLAGVLILLNPYGFDLVLFPVRLLGRGDVLSGVQEWQSPNFRDFGGQVFALWIVVMILAFARRRQGTRDLLVTLVFLVLALWAVRNTGLAVVVVLPVIARATRKNGILTDARAPAHRILVAVLGGALAFTVIRAGHEANWDLKRYPVKAVDAIAAKHLLGGRLVTTDGWGGYLIGTEWPRQQVFFDDRYDMYPLAVNDAYDSMAQLKPGWDRVLDHYRIEMVLWPRLGPLAQGLALRSDWTRVYADDQAVVYARATYLAARAAR
jgi:hypothetical protein